MLSRILLQLESKIVAKTRADLPPVYKIFLSGLFAKKVKALEPTQEERTQNEEAHPKISIKVDQMSFTAKEKEEFQSLCEFTHTSEPSSALLHIFPHVLGQQLIVSLIAHPIFPISAIGSLHLRSYFEVLQEKLLKEFLTNTSPTSFSMRGNYWGCTASPKKKGTDLVCSLEIWHNESAQPVWKELIVIYSTKNTRQHDTSAEDILQRCSNYCSFTNLEIEKSVPLSQVSTTKDETWNYGMLSGDINPIHMSEIGAKLFGQKGRIAHGAMILGKALTHLEQRQHISVSRKFGVSFKGPIPCGSTLNVNAILSDNTAKDMDLYVLNSDRPNICVRSF